MKKYLCSDKKYLSFVIESDIDNFLKINEYLTPYLYIQESNNTPQFFITNNEKYELIKFDDTYSYNEKIIFIKNGNIYSIKRVILDLYARLLEEKYMCYFYHASAVDNNGATIFVGNRGSGKTYNIIKKLMNNYSFISNDKIALIDNNVIGFPTSIGIRKKNLLIFDEYKEKYIKDGTYQDILAEKNDTYTKIKFNVHDFCKLLNCNIIPNSKLKEIVYLSDEELNKYIIDSVYEEQSFIKKMIKIRR